MHVSVCCFDISPACFCLSDISAHVLRFGGIPSAFVYNVVNNKIKITCPMSISFFREDSQCQPLSDNDISLQNFDE